MRQIAACRDRYGVTSSEPLGRAQQVLAEARARCEAAQREAAVREEAVRRRREKRAREQRGRGRGGPDLAR